MSASDPFYLVKEEIQDSANKVQSTFERWQQLPSSSPDRERLSKELASGCESVEWQVEELERAISVAERDPARFNVDAPEIERRRRWTSATRAQMAAVRRGLAAAASDNPKGADARRELLRMPEGGGGGGRNGKADTVIRDNEDFIGNESDRQALIMRAQDDDLDELSQHVERLGGVGLTIHEELQSQDRIITDLEGHIDTTANRLDYVQKKVAAVIKKTGVKGQILMIVFLLILVIILILLIFNT